MLLSGSVVCAETLDESVQALRASVPAVAAYIDACDALAWKELPFGRKVVLPQIPLQVLTGDNSDVQQGSLRYYLARKLVQTKLYDEAETVLNDVEPDKTLDPCGVLIHKTLVFHHQNNAEKGLETLENFKKSAENNKAVPRRYTELAKLLEFELKKEQQEQEKNQENNPEKIAKKMQNVRQRLGQGQTGDETQEKEKDIMKSLDRLIEKIEEQSKQQAEQDGEQQDGEGQQANNPADDSRILKQKGPGNVDRKEFDLNGNWGDLPPKEREEALIKIEKEFPAHYREIIEQYFREMAGKGN
jgi:hypothetical protein